jgi:hypothetical protein
VEGVTELSAMSIFVCVFFGTFGRVRNRITEFQFICVVIPDRSGDGSQGCFISFFCVVIPEITPHRNNLNNFRSLTFHGKPMTLLSCNMTMAVQNQWFKFALG